MARTLLDSENESIGNFIVLIQLIIFYLNQLKTPQNSLKLTPPLGN